MRQRRGNYERTYATTYIQPQSESLACNAVALARFFVCLVSKRCRKWVLGKSVLIRRHVMRSNEVDLVKREDVV